MQVRDMGRLAIFGHGPTQIVSVAFLMLNESGLLRGTPGISLNDVTMKARNIRRNWVRYRGFCFESSSHSCSWW
jgi:hypothetical protein